MPSIHELCASGDLAGLQELDLSLIDINENFTEDDVVLVDKGETPVFTACKYKHIEVVKWLLEQPSIDVNKPGERRGARPLHLISVTKDVSGILELLLNHPEINLELPYDGNTPLHLASRAGLDNTVTVLLARNVEINKINNAGLTPLATAKLQGNTKVAAILEVKGAQMPTVPSLHIACLLGDLDAVENFLQQRQLDINTTVEGMTPLVIACKFGNSVIADRLLRTHKASLNNAKEVMQPLVKRVIESDDLFLVIDLAECAINTKSNGYIRDYLNNLTLTPGNAPAPEGVVAGQTIHVTDSNIVILLAAETAIKTKSTLSKVLCNDNIVDIQATVDRFSIDGIDGVWINNALFEANRDYVQAQIFLFVVLVCDDYATVKADVGNSITLINATRFFNLLKEMPIDVQQRVIKIADNDTKLFISSKRFNDVLTDEVEAAANPQPPTNRFMLTN